ncbi:hypothetical protein [Scytonema sp. NUACC26]
MRDVVSIDQLYLQKLSPNLSQIPEVVILNVEISFVTDATSSGDSFPARD